MVRQSKLTPSQYGVGNIDEAYQSLNKAVHLKVSSFHSYYLIQRLISILPRTNWESFATNLPSSKSQKPIFEMPFESDLTITSLT